MMKKILVYGKVQRVFFRKFVRDNALRLGLRGYVRNLNDGSVEVVFEGDEKQIKEMIELCKKGPLGSRVDRVLVEEFSEDGFDSFEARY